MHGLPIHAITEGPHGTALPTGHLSVSVARADWPLDALCGFGARDNPRRGFLVVSKVLGRHMPARPRLMRRSARDLAARLPQDLPGPVLVVGLAETAICLGQTVHAEMREQAARADIAFIHSTRQRLGHPLLCRFSEPHSHASAHLVYRPELEGFATPRSLVLVDDELSTGTTLANAAAALVTCWPRIETIAVAVLTDWSDGRWMREMPRPTHSVALLRGTLQWTPRVDAEPSAGFDRAAGSLGFMSKHRNVGRLGLWTLDRDGPVLRPPSNASRLRIVGTGEFAYPAFLLAEDMERDGRDVVVQATSRSPARLGGALRTALTFDDNYGAGVPNYLYNADAADDRESWICHETGDASIDPRLVDALGARLIGWGA